MKNKKVKIKVTEQDIVEGARPGSIGVQGVPPLPFPPCLPLPPFMVVMLLKTM
jgi:hypothetical protein